MIVNRLKKIVEVIQISQWHSIGKYITMTLLFVFGAFLIPNIFINRHVTAEIFGVASITIVLSLLMLIYIKRLQFSLSDLLIVCFTIVWIASQYLGNWLPLQDQIHYISFCALLLILSNWIFSDNNIKKYYIIAICVGTIISLWGVAQYFNIVSTFYVDPSVTGSFDNPAGIGIFLAILSPFYLFYMQKESKPIKIATLLVSMLLIGTVILSQSRAALLSIVVISVLELSQIVKLPKYIRTHKRIFCTIALIICVVILLLLYYWKVDSANGRLLIWQIGWDMFLKNWFFGTGVGSFQAEYMLSQAEFFKLNPQSEFVFLADNVAHPFNEYLKIFIEYGILGFSILMSYVILLFRQYRQHRSNRVVRPLFLSLIAIGISALFSYPFKYPAIGVVLIIDLAIINSIYLKKVAIKTKSIVWIFKIVVLLLISLMIYFTTNWIVAEYTWNKTATSSLYGDSEKNIPTYGKLSKWLQQDGLFLYNYGAELNYIGSYAESNIILLQCSKLFNDVDVQLLLADNYFQLENYIDAEQHLLLASYMCPVRFTPLYKLFLLYVESGDKDKALDLGEKILNKSIKVQSSTIEYIKSDVKQKLTSLIE